MWLQGPPTSKSTNVALSTVPTSFPLVTPDDDTEIRPEVVNVRKTKIQETGHLRIFVD